MLLSQKLRENELQVFLIVEAVKTSLFIQLRWVFKEPQKFVRFKFNDNAVNMRDVTSLMETTAAGGVHC